MYILAIDQGTSSTKAILFDGEGKVAKKAVADLHTDYFSDGRVEQDPYQILSSVEEACREVLKEIDAEHIESIGISNQRETFVLWNSEGVPIYPAVVWACKRSTALCEAMKHQEEWVKKKTGLIIDPYFSGSKLLWILENEPDAAKQIATGEIHFGTIDTWLLYNLTNGEEFLTDHTNASRTLFFNIHDLVWDAELLEKWHLQTLKFPVVKPSSAFYATTNIFGLLPNLIPIRAIIGDSHAAMFGEACMNQGDTKMTLGTGCSMLMHIGDRPQPSKEGLLNTIGWSTEDQVAYAWEGAIVACGSMMEWLRSLKLLDDVTESEEMAMKATDTSEVLLVPAFSGLGAPFWQMDRKASFHGITFGTTDSDIVAATLETICFQIKAVVEAMESDLGQPISQIAMHGGLSKNKFIQQTLERLLQTNITMQENSDISAQGAAFLAGLSSGFFSDLRHIASLKSVQKLDCSQESVILDRKYSNWLNLIKTTQPK
ncbi:MAG: carbohydrate kinase [Pseudozobellia sp.]|nr:carbohydrate kinase [Pseudozobellia sp.]MBG50325.1 carbohydrate kinase [Pseudozobellia sp.]MBG50545.1 carbohydrate kinase [Pseudozobellia sp.]|tara:strand:- start:42064 stop:43524 length:1461 start_codon:yes stop_codon:yes gene_type:complete